MKLLIALSFLSATILSSYAKENVTSVDLIVNEKGFSPDKISVKAGSVVELKIKRITDSTCARSIQIPSKKIKQDLPLNKEVNIHLGVLKKGEIAFGCGMDMMAGGMISIK